MLVLGRESPHRDEPGEDDRLDRGLRPAGEHCIRIAALDQLRGLPHRVRPGRARRDRSIIRALDPERDRELPARRVDEDARDEARRDPLVPAFAEDLSLLHDPRDSPDRRAEGDPDPMGIEPVQSRIPNSLPPRGEGEQDVAVELALLLRRGGGARVEVLDLSGDTHRVIAGVEGADPVDPALAGKRGAPRLGR